MARSRTATDSSSASLGFEAKLWLAAAKLRSNMDAAEYKHVVLGLIFLKYISDTFEEHRAQLLAGKGDFAGANPEDKDEYLAANVFWVPNDARWPQLQSRAKLPGIGKDVDDAMVALERDNPRLKGALNKNYGRADLDKHRLGELIDLISTIAMTGRDASPQASADGSESRPNLKHRSVDILGRVFEYFLTQFASAEGKNGGPAKCEIRGAKSEVGTSSSFVIRNSHRPRERRHLPPRPGNGECRSANVELKSHE